MWRALYFFIALASLVSGHCLMAAAAQDPAKGDRQSPKRSGYVRSLDEEEQLDSSVEMYIPPPPSEKDKPLSQRIFNPELTKEFDDRYRQAFGQTEAEQNYNMPAHLSLEGFDYSQQPNLDQQRERRRDFGQYMVRRLTEYHIDNYAKKEPSVRPAYELKERLSTVKAEVVPGYRLNGKYSISGNLFDLKMENPFVRAKVTQELDSTGPSRSPETTWTAGRDLTNTISLDFIYKAMRDQTAMVIAKNLAPGLVSTLTTSSVGKRDINTGNDGEKLVLAGVSWNY